MTPEQFTYWLQGFVELSPAIPPTPAQWKSIGEHLATVFHKVTPPLHTVGPASMTTAGISEEEISDALRRAMGLGDAPPKQPDPGRVWPWPPRKPLQYEPRYILGSPSLPVAIC